MSEAHLDDLRRIVLRTISKNQILILTRIPRVPTSITSVLRELSRRRNIPLRGLQRDAEHLRSLNLIRYEEGENFAGVELTELGRFISSLTSVEEPAHMGNLVQTREGMRPLGEVIKDLRKMVLRMIAEAGSGHLGASLSAIDILAILYFMKMNHDPANPDWSNRDRLILSKGHAAPALYAVLAEAGYFDPDELLSVRELGSILQGHPDIKTPGVDFGSGSLGQGLSIAVGMALAAKIDNAPYRVYVILGDGELQEGQIWEAALTAAHYGLDNLVAVVDCNQYQLTGRVDIVKGMEPLLAKWRAFGWVGVETDGNNPLQVLDSLESCEMIRGSPSVIVAHTTKGKGVSFMEGNRFSRSVPDEEQLRRALMELS